MLVLMVLSGGLILGWCLIDDTCSSVSWARRVLAPILLTGAFILAVAYAIGFLMGYRP